MNAMEYIGTGDVERNWGITRRKQVDLRRTRQLPYSQIGHRTIIYRRADLEQFLARRKIEAVKVEG